MYSVKEAATKLNISERRVRKLLGEGRIKGKKLGRDWVVLDLNYTRKRQPKATPVASKGESRGQWAEQRGITRKLAEMTPEEIAAEMQRMGLDPASIAQPMSSQALRELRQVQLRLRRKPQRGKKRGKK